MTTLVRSAALTHFVPVASRLGLNPQALLAEVGLPARCLTEPDLKVPTRAVAQLLELAAARAHEPALALLMVEQRRLSNLGPLGLLMRDEPTLRSALEAVVVHQHLHNEAIAQTTEEAGSLVIIRQEFLDVGGPYPRQAAELALGVLFRVLTLFMGATWRPRLVCFSHAAPRDTTQHRRVFGPALAFGREFNGIVCSAEDLDAPNPAADPVMARYSRRLLQDDARREAQFDRRVRQLIVLLLPHGHCQVDVVARHLGVDRRTVARRLGALDTSFSALLDAVRADLVARYIEGPRPLAEVAALLGFDSPGSFSRWHRQRFGVTARSRASAQA